MKLEKLMDSVAKNILKIVFLVFLILGFIIKPMYSFDDFPYFTFIKLYDIVILGVVLIAFWYIYHKREQIQKKISYKWGFAYYIIITIILIILVPLTPFSDMGHVYKGAIKFSTFQWNEIMNDEYWKMFPGNIYLSVFWGIILLPFPKTLIAFKTVNAIFAYGIVYITSKICKEYQLKYYKVIYFMLLSFTPMILYVNHVYFDLPFVFFSVLSLYIFMKTDNIIIVGAIMGIAFYLRENAFIFFLAMFFVFIFNKVKVKLSLKAIYGVLIKIFFAIILFMVVGKASKILIKNEFLHNDYPSYPIWNQIYIGLNEPEFGFMDNDFSYDRDFGDVVNRIEEYGFTRTTKLICKKTFWLWTQGTYQAQRYAFGVNVENASDKFEYETAVTKYLLNDDQPLRIIINSFMRAQYLIMYFLMIYALWRKKDIADMRTLYYVLIATFIIMLVYELKSRYIFSCLPIMAILACWSLENIKVMKISADPKVD